MDLINLWIRNRDAGAKPLLFPGLLLSALLLSSTAPVGDWISVAATFPVTAYFPLKALNLMKLRSYFRELAYVTRATILLLLSSAYLTIGTKEALLGPSIIYGTLCWLGLLSVERLVRQVLYGDLTLAEVRSIVTTLRRFLSLFAVFAFLSTLAFLVLDLMPFGLIPFLLVPVLLPGICTIMVLSGTRSLAPSFIALLGLSAALANIWLARAVTEVLGSQLAWLAGYAVLMVLVLRVSLRVIADAEYAIFLSLGPGDK